MNVRPDYYDSNDEDSEYESGFSENSADGNEANPLPVAFREAIENEAIDEIELILNEIDVYESFCLDNGFKPLVYAASIVKLSVVECLLKYDSKKHEEAYASFTPLMAACSDSDESDSDQDKRSACIDLLLSSGHDLNFKDRYGETALMRACKCASMPIIELLLHHNANVNEVDNEGWSALFYATTRGDLDIVRFLCEKGADNCITDKRGRQAYMIATEKGFTEISDLIKPEEVETNEFVPQIQTSIFDEDDAHYRGEVLELVAATSASMKRYVPIFADAQLSLRDFLLMKSEEELKSLGILFSGHRKKILSRIKQFHLGIWLPESFGLPTKNEASHLLMLLNFVATLHRQIYVLRTSLEYVKDDMAELSPENTASVVNMLEKTKSELLRLKKRFASFKSYVISINTESRPYLAAEEIFI